MANFKWHSNSNNIGIMAQEVSELQDSFVYESAEPKAPGNITLTTGVDPMITISSDGFWIRGVKVPQDDQEAKTVYNAFKQWLVWANLSRQ